MNTNLPNVEFANNPESRCAVVLLLDRSGSMNGPSIDQVNEGLNAFAEEIKLDSLASLRVEVSIVTFGGKVDVLDLRNNGNPIDPVSADANQVFVLTCDFLPPKLTADGETPMGEAVAVGLRLIRERKAIYKQNGITYYRPWMFLITDGAPTDGEIWKQAAMDVKQEEGRKGVSFFGVGTENANMEVLSQFSSAYRPVKLQGLKFKEMFVWLSGSLKDTTEVKPGDQVALPSVEGWAKVDTSIR